MEILKVREEFEKAAIDRHVFGCSLDREIVSGVDQYKHPHLNACWLFWLAGAAIAPPVAAGSVDTLPEKECLGGDEAYGDRVYGFTEDQMIAWGAQQRAMQQEENNGIMREWAQRVVSAEDCAEKAEAELANKQAIIDRLMLEYCPDEMTAEQMAEWSSHQKRAE